MDFQTFKHITSLGFTQLSNKEILAFIENLLPECTDAETTNIDDLLCLYYDTVKEKYYNNQDLKKDVTNGDKEDKNDNTTIQTRVMHKSKKLFLSTRNDLIRYYTDLFGDNPYILTNEKNIWTYIGFTPSGPYIGSGYGVYIFNTCDVYISMWSEATVCRAGVLCKANGKVVKDLFIDDEALLCYDTVSFSNDPDLPNPHDIGKLKTLSGDETFELNMNELAEAEEFICDTSKQDDFIQLLKTFSKNL